MKLKQQSQLDTTYFKMLAKNISMILKDCTPCKPYYQIVAYWRIWRSLM